MLFCCGLSVLSTSDILATAVLQKHAHTIYSIRDIINMCHGGSGEFVTADLHLKKKGNNISEASKKSDNELHFHQLFENLHETIVIIIIIIIPRLSGTTTEFINDFK